MLGRKKGTGFEAGGGDRAPCREVRQGVGYRWAEMDMTDRKSQILDAILYAGSIIGLLAPTTCLYGLYRIIKAMNVADHAYYTTSGTILAYRLTIVTLVLASGLSVPFLRLHTLRRMALLNVTAGILIMSFTIMAAITQVLVDLPMTP
jgi:hypothetical protein